MRISSIGFDGREVATSKSIIIMTAFIGLSPGVIHYSKGFTYIVDPRTKV